MTALKKLREASGLSRREVSEICGINLRSLQDYEQEHKDITRANGELLYKLSLALGCTVEDILKPYLLPGMDEMYNTAVPAAASNGDSAAGSPGGFVDVRPVRTDDFNQRPASAGKIRDTLLTSVFRSNRNKICGRWVDDRGSLAIVFVYGGIIVKLPLPAVVSEQTLPWLPAAAVMRMESYIENIRFLEESRKLLEKTGADTWNDWE